MGIAAVIYIAYLLIFLAINAAIIFHFIKHSFPRDATKFNIITYLLVVAFIIISTLVIVGIV